MTTAFHRKLSFRRCWINKTNDFKSNYADFGYLNISDCPLITAEQGSLTISNIGGFARVTTAPQPFTDGQVVTISGCVTPSYNGKHIVSGCDAAGFMLSAAYFVDDSGTWAGSWDVSDTTQVKITIQNSLLKDIDLTQSYTSEVSNYSNCKMSKVAIGASKLKNCEEITGSTYLYIKGNCVFDTAVTLNLTIASGVFLIAANSGIGNSIDLTSLTNNLLELENCIVVGNITFESGENHRIVLANTDIISSGNILSIQKGSTGSSSLKMKNTTIEGDLTMVSGTILEKYNSQVLGLTLIDNGVQVSYGDAEKALKAVQIIMTGN